MDPGRRRSLFVAHDLLQDLDGPLRGHLQPLEGVREHAQALLLELAAEVRTTMDSPSTIRVNMPQCSGMCEARPGTKGAVKFSFSEAHYRARKKILPSQPGSNVAAVAIEQS
jgi:hypothetical protein